MLLRIAAIITVYAAMVFARVKIAYVRMHECAVTKDIAFAVACYHLAEKHPPTSDLLCTYHNFYKTSRDIVKRSTEI